MSFQTLPPPRTLLAAVAVAIVLLVPAAGAPPARAVATEPTIRELVGQRFVVAMRGTPPSPRCSAGSGGARSAASSCSAPTSSSPAQLRGLTATLQRAAREAGRPPLADRDRPGGGTGASPPVGRARCSLHAELGRLDARSDPRRRGSLAGRHSGSRGVNVDLAPVARRSGARARSWRSSSGRSAPTPLGVGRGGGRVRPGTRRRARRGCGEALSRDRDAPHATPTARRSRSRASRAALDRIDLAPFRAAIAAGVPIVMISNATYPALDAKPAPWSPRIQSLLRDELGFEGVTISDALDGAAATRGRALAIRRSARRPGGRRSAAPHRERGLERGRVRARRRRCRAGSTSRPSRCGELRPDRGA